MEFTPEKIRHYKWPVSVSRKINASPQRIWAAISAPGNLENCHPFCRENPVYNWPGAGSQDAVHYYSGWILRRTFVNWMEGVGYDLTIGKEGGGQSYVTWRIAEEPENSGRLTITIYPYIFQNIPAVLRRIPYAVKVQPALRRYLASVLQGFEWFITSGQPVTKNQFGRHEWFSP